MDSVTGTCEDAERAMCFDMLMGRNFPLDLTAGINKYLLYKQQPYWSQLVKKLVPL